MASFSSHYFASIVAFTNRKWVALKTARISSPAQAEDSLSYKSVLCLNAACGTKSTTFCHPILLIDCECAAPRPNTLHRLCAEGKGASLRAGPQTGADRDEWPAPECEMAMSPGLPRSLLN
jgi:hypothetical protein